MTNDCYRAHVFKITARHAGPIPVETRSREGRLYFLSFSVERAI